MQVPAISSRGHQAFDSIVIESGRHELAGVRLSRHRFKFATPDYVGGFWSNQFITEASLKMETSCRMPNIRNTLRPGPGLAWMCPILVMLSFPAAAEPTAPERPWQGEVELGFVTTRGNTDTDSLNAKAKVVNEREIWRNSGRIDAVNNATDGVRNAEHYFAVVKSDRKFSEVSYFFASLNYDDDRFSGYDYRSALAIGYGRNVIKREGLALDLELGAGARRSRLDDATDAEDEGIVSGAMRINWQFSTVAEFGEDLSVEAGEISTITRSITSVKSTVAANIALKVTVTAQYTSDVPPTIKNSDVETATTVVYSF